MKLSTHRTLLAAFSSFLAAFVVTNAASATEDDYEFMPLHAWRILGETGEDDATSALMEGFPGLRSEPSKNRWIEPVDGSGGFDNVAPRLSVEEGPGGLDWDLSPTYRTRYKSGTDHPTSTTNPQGNNWFTKIPYFVYDSALNEYRVRFDANTFRVYEQSGSTHYGRYGNNRSQFKGSGSVRSLYDIGGKVYTFDNTTGRLTKIDGVGDAEIVLTYNGTTSIDVIHRSDYYTDVRKFTYTLEASGTRIDKIEVYEKDGASWNKYRTVDFTYHDNVTGATESVSGDLVGIEDEKDLSESGKTYERNWVFKYYTGTYNSSSNPGNQYQVKAVIGPGSVAKYLADNSTKTVTDLYKTAASSLSGYVDRSYEYQSDRRAREITFESGCGCGGSSGVYDYTWGSSTPPSDLNTWYHSVTIEPPNGSAHILDYNKYGQTLNSIVQEDASDSGSRRWIRKYTHNYTGSLSETFSVAACTSYNATTHTVTTNSTDGMRYTYSYDVNEALTTVKLRNPANGNLLYQRKCAFTKKTSSDRVRFLKTSETRYPTETTSDTGGETTTYAYTYHGDPLAVKKRTTTLPTVTTAQNGPNTAVLTYDYLESDLLQTWRKDGEGRVHYTGYDADRRTVTLQVTDVDTDTADRPSGVPAAPETTFQSSTGLNLVTRMEYDELRRITKRENPAFDAWNGTTVTSTKVTPRWHYTKLSAGELVTLQYPHVDSSYHHAAISMSVLDHDGNVLTSARGELSAAKRNTNLDDDFDETDSTLSAAFEGTIIERTDHEYAGGKRTKTEVWSDADNGSADKFTTTNTYDDGLLETTKTPAGTITRYAYDVLGRRKSRKVGTVDGGGSDNMTLVEEWFYDDEEDTSGNVGDGFLTRSKVYTSYLSGGERITETTYDYRGRAATVFEELDVSEDRTYDNLGRITLVERYDDSGTPELIAKTQSYFDAWGQVYETRVYGITGGSGTSYSKTEHWYDKRGLELKSESQGDVFTKTEYDGAGRATRKTVSCDTDETSYAAADDLTGDTVIEETIFELDDTGAAILVGQYQRRHNGTGTGSLTVGSSGNGRAQYSASWFDEFHRDSVSVSYGTNDGTDLTTRPSGNPPTSSGPSHADLVQDFTNHCRVPPADSPAGGVALSRRSAFGIASFPRLASERIHSTEPDKHLRNPAPREARDEAHLHGQGAGGGRDGRRWHRFSRRLHRLGRDLEAHRKLRRRHPGHGRRRPHDRIHLQRQRPAPEDHRQGG